ncbi:MAG TPA: FtsX-like permease family protein [Streptosporangiaceae bacterium]
MSAGTREHAARPATGGWRGNGRGHGGVAARRALVRWAWRLFRRDWRQQILTLGLLGLAVTAAVLSASVASNMVPLRAADFGTATARIQLDGPGDAGIAAARKWFGTIDVINHAAAPVPGSIQTVDVRAQDPHGPYGRPMLRLRAGRYPARPGEVALTDHAASLFDTGLGRSLVLAGSRLTVVGTVENPSDLSDTFALVAPQAHARAESTTILVRADAERVASFRGAGGARPTVRERGRTENGAAALVAFAATTLTLLLVAFIAAAGFAVVAQRRLRQLGMLAAIGATARHLRLVMLAGGALIGGIAALIGTAAGLAGWFAGAPWLEPAAGHRIDRLAVPWAIIGADVVLAVATATAAAWWPARTAARVPIVRALSARPPRPKQAHRPAIAAVLLLMAGVGCLALGVDTAKDHANPPLFLAGTIAIALGILFAGPLAVRVFGGSGSRLPVAVRLAFRDLVRYQARSAAALAAISLALGMAVAVAIIATTAKHPAAEGNLSDRQLLVRIGTTGPVVPERTPAQVAGLRSQVDRFAATLPHSSVVALYAAVGDEDRETSHGKAVRPMIGLGRHVGSNSFRDVGMVYVATPDLLRRLRLTPRPDVDVLTSQPGPLSYVNAARDAPTPRTEHVDVPRYSSGPSTLITPYGLRRAGWQAAPVGWLIEADQPLTAAQITAAKHMSVNAGLTLESRDEQRSLATVRTVATIAGALVALGVLAMTVGLIRGESARDLRTLIATGATGSIRRTLAAATAGGLALLGALLGTMGAYLALFGAYVRHLGMLSHVPVLSLVATVAGVPLLATATAWLLPTRRPPALTRQAID